MKERFGPNQPFEEMESISEKTTSIIDHFKFQVIVINLHEENENLAIIEKINIYQANMILIHS